MLLTLTAPTSRKGTTSRTEPTYLFPFLAKLASERFRKLVRNFSRAMTVRMFESLPDFGKSVAIDSTDIKAWSNAGKKGKKRSWGPSRGPKRRRDVSDHDAGWVVKTNTEGRQKYVWGYKVHILCDTTL